MSNAAASWSQSHSSKLVSPADSGAIPWLQLRARVREGLARRHHYVASSQDLSLLWSDETVDAAERRRRITVFAAQHQWRVETCAEGTSARFESAPVSGLREMLSRNHE